MMKKTPWLCVISILLCAGLLFGCGKNDEEDSSGRSNRSKSSDVEASESDESEDSKESEKSKDSTKDTDATSEVTTTSSETSSETTTAPEVTTTEETLQETSQNTEIPTEPTRSLSDEEAEMSRLRDEEEDDDGEEEDYDEPSEDGNGNGGNGGTTSTQPTYATEPDVGPDVSKPQGHWETRVISEAWDETVVDTPAWDEEVKVVVGTQWTQNDTGIDETGWTPSQQAEWCESHNCPYHYDDYDASKPGYCANNCTGRNIYETQTIHHEAETHTVHHEAVTEQVWVED